MTGRGLQGEGKLYVVSGHEGQVLDGIGAREARKGDPDERSQWPSHLSHTDV